MKNSNPGKKYFTTIVKYLYVHAFNSKIEFTHKINKFAT